MIIIGIDPGLEGAIAVLRMPGTVLLDAHHMPTLSEKVGKHNRKRVSASALRTILAVYTAFPGDKLVMLERVTAMPKQGVTSMFSFGRSLGIAEGIVAGLALPLDWVTPQEWMRAVKLKGKDNARAIATERFPQHQALFARPKDEGRADAALIALYASLTHQPKPDVGAHDGATLGDDLGPIL